MVRINVREAKAKLSAYLAMVEQGEEVVIHRRGKPVAVLKSAEMPSELVSMKDFRENIQIKGLPASETVVKMREDSRY